MFDVYVNKVNVFLTFHVTPIIRVCIVTRCMCVQEKTCDGVVLMLLANKLDLADGPRRAVTAEQGRRLAAVRARLNIQSHSLQ